MSLENQLPVENLSTLNEELENYFRNTIIPQVYIDGNLILRKFTPPAMKQFDLDIKDLGRHLKDIKDNFRFPSLADNISQVIKNNEILEKEVQTTDMRWYLMNIIPYVVYKTRKTNGVIITFVDITSRVRDLKEQEKLVSDHETLLDTLTHDIRNPLSNLQLAISQLKGYHTNDQEEYDMLVGIVERGIGKIKGLLDELQQHRYEEHKYKAHTELLDLEHIIEDVRLGLSVEIENTGAIITSNLRVSEIMYSRRQIRSVLYNLVSNAIKYKAADRQPKISISSSIEDRYVVISVADNGIGIDSDKQEAVFSKYFRINKEIEGTGIGLYLVKRIVTTSGGKMVLNSRPGESTQVKVYIPHHLAEANQSAL